jgi:hypothetical protein
MSNVGFFAGIATYRLDLAPSHGLFVELFFLRR